MIPRFGWAPNQIDPVILSVFVVYFSLVLIYFYRSIISNRNELRFIRLFAAAGRRTLKRLGLTFDIPAIIITRVRMLLLICISVDLDLVHQHHDSTK